MIYHPGDDFIHNHHVLYVFYQILLSSSQILHTGIKTLEFEINFHGANYNSYLVFTVSYHTHTRDIYHVQSLILMVTPTALVSADFGNQIHDNQTQQATVLIVVYSTSTSDSPNAVNMHYEFKSLSQILQ